jgi:hypothetical protein
MLPLLVISHLLAAGVKQEGLCLHVVVPENHGTALDQVVVARVHPIHVARLPPVWRHRLHVSTHVLIDRQRIEWRRSILTGLPVDILSAAAL